jgi:hypothetical protein
MIRSGMAVSTGFHHSPAGSSGLSRYDIFDQTMFYRRLFEGICDLCTREVIVMRVCVNHH